ncbi:hypothetical protein P3342_007651 [Pyrenophora teres f. teres]|nr:hypothetical protein P3342_007651 [Pyrenophora teres f. teres]
MPKLRFRLISHLEAGSYASLLRYLRQATSFRPFSTTYVRLEFNVEYHCRPFHLASLTSTTLCASGRQDAQS